MFFGNQMKLVIYVVSGIFLLGICLYFVYTLDFSKSGEGNPPAPIEVTNEQSGTVSSIMGTDQYKEAQTSMSGGDVDQAIRIFEEMKNDNIYIEQVSHLDLKQLQAELSAGRYDNAVERLVRMVSNPTYPSATKARAMENVFMVYRGEGSSEQIYNTVFDHPFFLSMKAEASREGWYEYMKYAYNLFPTTVFGRHIILTEIDRYRLLEGETQRNEEKQRLQNSIVEFFASSDKEVGRLTALDNQEPLLVSIHYDRADVLATAHRANLDVPEAYSIETEFVASIGYGKETGVPYYAYYPTARYLSYLYATKAQPDERLVEEILNEEIFNPEIITQQAFDVSVGSGKAWSEAELAFYKELSPPFARLIERYGANQ